MGDIVWTNDRRKLRDLIPQEDNPRQIRKPQAERLVKSWNKFNQPDVISIGPDNKIYNGHQRYYVWMAAYGADFEVDVRISSRKLAKREWQELTVLMHEGAIGEWNFDGLAEWDGVDVGDLMEWGFDEFELTGMPIIDDGELAQQHSDRIKPTGDHIVVGFGKFAGLVLGKTVDDTIVKIKSAFGDNADAAMTKLCEFINESSFD